MDRIISSVFRPLDKEGSIETSIGSGTTFH